MAFECSAKEFIKVYRKFMNWEWYKDVNTKSLFLHCLLRANWKAGEWHGIPYEAGEFITSLRSLADETGLTMRQTRTSLDHLIATGELSSSLTNRATGKKLSKCRIITVNNWNSYQASDKQNDKQSASNTSGKRQAKRQATRKQSTTDTEHKNIRTKEEKKVLKEKSATRPADAAAADEEEDNDDAVDLGAMTDEEFEKYLKETHKNGAV